MSVLSDDILNHPLFEGLRSLRGVELPDLVRSAIANHSIATVDPRLAVDVKSPKFSRVEKLVAAVAGNPYGARDKRLNYISTFPMDLPTYLEPVFDRAARHYILELSDAEFDWTYKAVKAGKEIKFDADTIKTLMLIETLTPEELALHNPDQVDGMYMREGPEVILGQKAVATDQIASAWAKRLITQFDANPLGIFGNPARFIRCAINPAIVAKIETLPKSIIKSSTSHGIKYGTKGGLFATEKGENTFKIEDILADKEMEAIFDALATHSPCSSIIDYSGNLPTIWADIGAALWLQDLNSRSLLGRSPYLSSFEVLLGGRETFALVANHAKAKEFIEAAIKEPDLYNNDGINNNVFCNAGGIIRLLDASFTKEDLLRYLRETPKATMGDFSRTDFPGKLQTFLKPPAKTDEPPVITGKPLADVIATLQRKFVAEEPKKSKAS